MRMNLCLLLAICHSDPTIKLFILPETATPCTFSVLGCKYCGGRCAKFEELKISQDLHLVKPEVLEWELGM